MSFGIAAQQYDIIHALARFVNPLKLLFLTFFLFFFGKLCE